MLLKEGYILGLDGKPVPRRLGYEQMARELELQIRINELIPAELRSKGAIAKMKRRLRRLKRRVAE
jgi:hypothetical protein